MTFEARSVVTLIVGLSDCPPYGYAAPRSASANAGRRSEKLRYHYQTVWSANALARFLSR